MIIVIINIKNSYFFYIGKTDNVYKYFWANVIKNILKLNLNIEEKIRTF